MKRLKALYNLRIKHKLLILIFFALSMFAITVAMTQKLAFDFYDHELYVQSSQALRITSFSIENELQKIERKTFDYSTDQALQEYLKVLKYSRTNYDSYTFNTPINDRLVSIGALDKYNLSVHVYDAQKRTFSVGRSSITLSPERFLKVEQESMRLAGANGWIPRDDKDHSLIATREIRSYENLNLEHLGVLAIRLDIDKLLRELSKGLSQSNAKLVIMADHKPIYSDETNFPLQQLTSLPVDEDYQTLKFGGERYFITSVASKTTNWTYYTLIPYDNIFNKISQLKNIIFYVYLGVVLFVSIIVTRISKFITAPIERLNAKMKRVQLGKFTTLDDDDDPPLIMDETGQMHRNFRMMVEQIQELIHENYVKQLTIRDTELKALQSQINPHFLYNTLESINWTAKVNGQQEISKMVEALGSLLRTSIRFKEPLIPLIQELDLVGHYVTIQKFRFEERLDFHMEIPASLEKCYIPKLSIQPLVENAVNYALEQMIDTCIIKVIAYVQDKQLYIVVSDNGPGMEEGMSEGLLLGVHPTTGSGVGIKNIDDRIKLLFGEEYGVQIESQKNNGVNVKLILPFKGGE